MRPTRDQEFIVPSEDYTFLRQFNMYGPLPPDFYFSVLIAIVCVYLLIVLLFFLLVVGQLLNHQRSTMHAFRTTSTKCSILADYTAFWRWLHHYHADQNVLLVCWPGSPCLGTRTSLTLVAGCPNAIAVDFIQGKLLPQQKFLYLCSEALCAEDINDEVNG